MAVTKTASSITWPTTFPGVAPNALLIPISCVRSFTTMIMMLLMPTIPGDQTTDTDEPQECIDAREDTADHAAVLHVVVDP